MEKQKGAPLNKTLWQAIKFVLVSCLVSVIQLVLVNVLFYAMRSWKAPLPAFLQGIFSARSVGVGNDNWGYVLPFFLSNLIANIYGFFQNKRTTFKSDAPAWCFWVYVLVMVALILFSTWLQGVVAHALIATGQPSLSALAPTLAAMSAGMVQMLILFPLEKFVLLRERREGT